MEKKYLIFCEWAVEGKGEIAVVFDVNSYVSRKGMVVPTKERVAIFV